MTLAHDNLPTLYFIVCYVGQRICLLLEHCQTNAVCVWARTSSLPCKSPNACLCNVSTYMLGCKYVPFATKQFFYTVTRPLYLNSLMSCTEISNDFHLFSREYCAVLYNFSTAAPAKVTSCFLIMLSLPDSKCYLYWCCGWDEVCV